MKIGMTVSRDRLEFPIAGHFGKAKWLLVYEGSGQARFLPNTGLNGAFVADVLAAEGCTDVIALQLGPGAFNHLRAKGLRIWQAEEPEPPAALAKKLAAGELKELTDAPPHGHAGGHCC